MVTNLQSVFVLRFRANLHNGTREFMAKTYWHRLAGNWMWVVFGWNESWSRVLVEICTADANESWSSAYCQLGLRADSGTSITP
jgi:hypothetical protein